MRLVYMLNHRWTLTQRLMSHQTDKTQGSEDGVEEISGPTGKAPVLAKGPARVATEEVVRALEEK